MATTINANEIKQLTENFYLSVESKLFDEILEKCKERATNGFYHYYHKFDNLVEHNEILIVKKKLESMGFIVESRINSYPKTRVRWYTRMKNVEYHNDKVMTVAWND